MMPTHIANVISADSNAIKSRVGNAPRTGYEIVFSAWIKCLIKRDTKASDLLKEHLECLKGGECGCQWAATTSMEERLESAA